MDRFDAMRVFTRVVEQRSFTRAAEDLGLPRSTVTDAVKWLEARLGAKLLERTTRHVASTLDGAAYYQRCLAILADLEEAEGAIAGAGPKGMLRVDVHGSLARHFLLPTLPSFLQAYPAVELYMSEGDRIVDLVREGFDCVIRVGTPVDSDMVGRRVALLEEVTLASPAYLARHGVPRHPDDLAGHRIVGFRSSATGGLLPLEFIVEGSVRHVVLPTRVSVNAGESYLSAARQGLGLIQIPRYHAQGDLDRGTLVAVLEAFPLTKTPVSVLYPRNRQLSPRVRVFIDWIVEAFARRERGDEPGKC